MNEYDLLTASLTFLAIVTIGGSVLSARSARHKHMAERLKDLSARSDRRRQEPESEQKVISLVQRLGNAISLGKVSTRLREELTRAGYHNPSAGAVYLGAKCLLLLAGLAGLPALLLAMDVSLPLAAIMVLSSATVLFFLPNAIVASRRRKRRTVVRNHLPDAVDLLEVCVSSGMGLDMAWNIVADEVRRVCPTLGDEMELTNVEIHLGSPRVVAMRHLAERVGVEEIGSMVAMMVQSDKFGTSIAETLRVFAASMREARSMRAQEEAEKMAVRLLLPLVLFIFPALFFVLVGPAVLRLSQTLFSGS